MSRREALAAFHSGAEARIKPRNRRAGQVVQIVEHKLNTFGGWVKCRGAFGSAWYDPSQLERVEPA